MLALVIVQQVPLSAGPAAVRTTRNFMRIRFDLPLPSAQLTATLILLSFPLLPEETETLYNIVNLGIPLAFQN